MSDSLKILTGLHAVDGPAASHPEANQEIGGPGSPISVSPVGKPAEGKGAAPAPDIAGAVLPNGGKSSGAGLELALRNLNKPGWRTTELWVLLAMAGLAQWMAAHGHGSPDLTNFLTMFASGVYAWFRLTHKSQAVGEAAAALQQAVPQIASVADLEAAVGRQLEAHQGEILNAIRENGGPRVGGNS